MAEILYYEHPDLLNFRASIISVSQTSGETSVILDRTAFYPEGGGQPADHGMINGYRVTDVRKTDGEIYHIIEPGVPFSSEDEGKDVECSIDFEHRFDYMQQHSGQHLVSAAMMSIAGIGTISVHQGAEYTAVEVEAVEITPELIREIEDEANRFIRSDTPITAEWTDAEGLQNYKLRRPSKHNENIRIINIQGIDCVACGGMHLKTTAEIGLIKFSHQEKIRGRVRTFWKIGKRAYDDYAEKTNIINSLNELFSSRQYELPEKAEAAIGNIADLKFRYNKLEEEYAEVYASVMVSEAEKIAAEGKPAVIVKVFENRSKGFLLGLLKALSLRGGNSCSFIFNKTGDSLTWAVAAGKDADFDFKAFQTDYLPLIDGKGGGRAPLWQGAARNPGGLDSFIDRIRRDRM